MGRLRRFPDKNKTRRLVVDALGVVVRRIHSVVALVVAVVACDLVQRKARAPGENLIVHWT